MAEGGTNRNTNSDPGLRELQKKLEDATAKEQALLNRAQALKTKVSNK